MSDLFETVLTELGDYDVVEENMRNCPSYWSSNPGVLATTTNVAGIAFGTGHSLYSSSILPAITKAQSEVILVTCFWARSDTLEALNEALRKLSANAIEAGTTIRVRICFSSSSLLQKLLHTLSLAGHTYPPTRWQATLGLPAADELRGLDLQVKSIFVLPFSVMHPKFVIIDRRQVFLPSCNVSWEDWFEGCMALSGPVTSHFVTFWQSFWASDGDCKHPFHRVQTPMGFDETHEAPSSGLLAAKSIRINEIQSIFLPSPHHRNPQFTLPWLNCPPPPKTPLNIFLLGSFARAAKTIFIQTPNLTSPPVLSALLTALERGINVHIVTSERLMVLEQLVTAGTTTKRCVDRLVGQHKQLVSRCGAGAHSDLEAGLVTKAPGELRVEYFEPRNGASGTSVEPVQSHLKLTIVDDCITVHGSGNMDRASWYTSQELGVAFNSAELVANIKDNLFVGMEGRSKIVFDSNSR